MKILKFTLSFFIGIHAMSCSLNSDFEKIDAIRPPEVPPPVTYTLSLVESEGGKASMVPQKESYDEKETIKITATASDGYTFKEWSGTQDSTDNPFILEIQQNEELTPIFTKNPDPPEPPVPPEPEKYSINIDTVTGGKSAIVPSKTGYLAEEKIKLTATPDEGYAFSQWSGTIEDTKNPLVLSVKNEEWIIPVFSKIPEPEAEPEPITFTLKIDEAEGGEIKITPLKSSYEPNENIMITVTADDGYQFDTWTGTKTGSEKEFLICITGNQWLIPHFTLIPVIPIIPDPQLFSVTCSVTGSGQIKLTPEKQMYAENEKVLVSAVGDDGYMLGKWNTALSGQESSREITVTGDTHISATFIKRKWTVILYMAADNNLESMALQDFNEIEAGPTSGQPIDILVLLDRGPGYDSTNGDWTDTRLYKISEDSGGQNAVLNSKRISCGKLGISDTSSTELNMADPSTLDFLLSSAKEMYPAEEYGLIFWGHGTGWRSSGLEENTGLVPSGSTEPLKAVAFDDTGTDFMTIGEAASAVKGKNFSVVGFDTCFGSLLEIAYEFRNPVAKYLIGSEGATPSTGWNYTKLFDLFLQTDLSTASFYGAAVSQFSEQYAGVPKATISVIDLGRTAVLRNDFEEFCKAVAGTINSRILNIALRNILFQNCDLYRVNTFPCDTYIDMHSMQSNIVSRFSTNQDIPLSGQNAIRNSATKLASSITAAVPLCWSQEAVNKKRIGVHFIPFTSAEIPQLSHEAAYIRESGASFQSEFVRNSYGWAPNFIPSGSLLDKLFYTIFP